MLERSTGARLWNVIFFLAKLFVQGVTVGLIANAIEDRWLPIFFRMKSL